MKLNRCALLLATVCSPSITLSALTTKEAKAIYDADTLKVRAGDLQFDWKEYRLAAETAGAEGSFDWHPVRNRCMQQLQNGDFDAALKSAEEIKNHNMAWAEGHLLAMMVFQKMGRQQDASFEHDAVAAYLKSITASGDGSSSDTAYFVVNVDEEYFFLNIVMGVGLPESQSLVEKNGHSFDRLKVKDRDGKELELWFNVDTSMNSMRDAIEGANKK
jgi:Domain of unknown function (DUF4919)